MVEGARSANGPWARKVLRQLIDLAQEEQHTWVVEIQYTEGALLRGSFDVRADAVRAYEWARDRASTDWQRLYGISITTIWVEALESRIDHIEDREDLPGGTMTAATEVGG